MDAQPETTRRGAADWLVLVGRFAALVYLNALMWLSVWVLIPTFFMGWQPMAIETGSMGPSIRTGDVVLVESYHGQPLEAGRVITFRDPADPDRLVTHRVTSVNADGTYQTKGDANVDADSTPLTGEHIRGVGRLVIPRVGLPVVWMEHGHYGALGAWAVSVLFALVLLAPSRPEEQPSRVPLSAPLSRFLRRSPATASGGAPVGFSDRPLPQPPAPSGKWPSIPLAAPTVLPAPAHRSALSLPVPPESAAMTAPGAAAVTAPAVVGWAQVPGVRYRMRLPAPPMALELPAPPRWTVAMVPPPPGTAPVAPIPAPPRPAAVRRGTALSSRDVPGWAGRLHS